MSQCFVVAKKENAAGGRVWSYWTGTAWSKDRAAAKEFPDRDAALAAHAELLKAQAWTPGGNPLVVEG